MQAKHCGRHIFSLWPIAARLPTSHFGGTTDMLEGILATSHMTPKPEKADECALRRTYGHIKIFSSQSKWDYRLADATQLTQSQCGQISSCRPALVIGLDLATQSAKSPGRKISTIFFFFFFTFSSANFLDEIDASLPGSVVLTPIFSI